MRTEKEIMAKLKVSYKELHDLYPNSDEPTMELTEQSLSDISKIIALDGEINTLQWVLKMKSNYKFK